MTKIEHREVCVIQMLKQLQSI